MNKLNLKLVPVVLIAVMALFLAQGCITITAPGLTTSSASVNVTTPPPINPSWTPPTTTTTIITTQAGQTEDLPDIADAVALVKPSVVAINTQVVSYDFFSRPYTQEGAGSGWIIDGNGIIVTNNHVIEGAKSISVTMDDGSTYTADVNGVATDTLNDLAILKINASNLPALKMGDSSALRVGDWVIAIGNALGQGIRATEGIVSRQGVSLDVSQGETLYDLIETSAAINPGNSGGPLVNLKGEVIGITSAKVAQVGVEGMGYAISTQTATPIIQELVNKGYVTRPWLGVGLYTVDQLAISQLNLKVDKGVVIVQMVSGSPADQAGLQEGDVIVEADGQEVTTVEELTKIIHSATIGQPLSLKFYRGSSEHTVTVTPIQSPRP
jgi:serine protease Do